MIRVEHDGVGLSSLSLGLTGRRPLLLLHGLVSGNLSVWYSSIAAPLSADRQVVLYDLRGHGDSDLPARGYDLVTQAGDLRAVLAAHVAVGTPVELVGHSFGALVALRFALQWPEAVSRLVLIDAPMPARDWISPSLLAARSPRALAEWIETDPSLAGQPSGRRRTRLLKRLEALLFGTSLVADILAADSEPEAVLRECRLPVRLIYGRRSPCLAAGEHLARHLPDARLELIDCGHYVPVEAPAELLRRLSGPDSARCPEVPSPTASTNRP